MRAAIWIAFLANLTAYPMSNGLLPYIAREIYGAQPDRPRLSLGEFRDRLADRLDDAEPDRRYPRRPADDRCHRDLVRDAIGVRADTKPCRQRSLA